MKLFPTFSYTGVLAFFLLLFAAPAFAQFEVNPDHFDQQPPASPKRTTASTRKHDLRTTLSSAVAAHNLSTAKSHGAARTSRGKKLQPGTHSASGTASVATTTTSARRRQKSTSAVQAAPNLKAHLAPVHRE